MAEERAFPTSYRDPLYAQLDSGVEQKLGLPVGLLSAIRTEGERTNADRVSSAGARTPYQIIPATRDAILKRDGIDAYLSPQNAAEVAGILLRDSLKRNENSPEAAVREYHGGTDRKAWGPVNNAYWQRVSAGFRDTATRSLSESFGRWLQDNPAEGQLPSANPPDTPAPADLSAGFGAWLQAQQPAPQIPPVEGVQAPPAVAPIPDTRNSSLADKLVGAGEAALTTVTGATGGALGMIGGTLKGLAEQILSGQFGTQEAAGLVEKSAAEGAQALTYQPRTAEGQEQAAAVGGALQQLIPVAGVLPSLQVPGARPAPVPARVTAQAAAEGAARAVAGEPGAAAVARGISTAGRVADMAGSRVTTLPRRALEALRREQPEAATPGTMGSAGAAGTDMATQRRATAAELGFTGDAALTKGQASRDAAQLKFETETAKLPEAGAPLRQRIVAQNQRILEGFDNWVDQTGAEAPTLRAVGQAVDKAIVEQAAADKARIRAAYKAADAAGELEAPVTLDTLVAHLNEVAPEAPTAPLIDVARRVAIRQGIATEGADGSLVAAPVTLRRAESFRQAVSRATDYEPTNVRQATIMKGLVDESTSGLGGNLYRQARAMRARFAQNYEDRAVISKLLNEKRGTADRAVALEDVFGHTILKGSLDDVRNVRRVLHRSGPEGAQAWRELQGATVQWLKEEATKNVATDSAGNRVISPAALDKAVRTLDVDGRLDFIFGKKGAQRVRDMRDLAQVMRTVPPEAAVNTSNTVSALMAAFGDVGAFGLTGAPVPVVTMAKFVRQYVKDRALRRRIEEALNETARKQAPGRDKPPAAAPGRGETLH